jgi:multidrug efflux system outer membrane protein
MIPGIRASIQMSKYQIATLLGETVGTFNIDLEKGARQPTPRMSTKTGIPADLLRNRPDVRIAERLYYASVADIGAAEAELYPSLSLSGAITYATIGGGADGTEYFFGPTVRLPALPGGARKAAVAARESRARQAYTSWKSTVVDAINEVESALVEYVGSTSSVYTSQEAVKLYREAVTLTRDLVTQDGATIRELLEAEESVANADATLATNLRLKARTYISLNVSLGSGSAYGSPVAILGESPPAPPME